MSAESYAHQVANDYHYHRGDDFYGDVADLQDTVDLLRAVEERLNIEVQNARANGVTWAVIGKTLGVTHQAASKRFGKLGTLF